MWQNTWLCHVSYSLLAFKILPSFLHRTVVKKNLEKWEKNLFWEEPREMRGFLLYPCSTECCLEIPGRTALESQSLNALPDPPTHLKMRNSLLKVMCIIWACCLLTKHILILQMPIISSSNITLLLLGLQYLLLNGSYL